jgi:hypothetical protein
MELVQPLISWRPSRHLNVARDRLAALLARTRWFGSPQALRPSQLVSPMSDEWLREHDSRYAAHRGDSL